MNESSKSIRALLDFYKLEPKDILVIHDDLDLSLETLRTTNSSGAAGHNGVKDIIDRLGTQDFSRIRIGIGRPEEVLGFCQPGHEYVLGRLTEKEIEAQGKKLPEILERISHWLAQ
jgi:PTH1 family peptidyl-tRNA hydrolase